MSYFVPHALKPGIMVLCQQNIFVNNVINLFCLLEQEKEGLLEVEEWGLVINRKHQWMAGSPDGIIKEDDHYGLLEIKCPAKKRLYPYVPSYYIVQIQGLMGLISSDRNIDLEFCDFVVWTPEETSITRIDFDHDYYHEELFPNLEYFYFNDYVPLYNKHRPHI